jgi:hypothetical protein
MFRAKSRHRGMKRITPTRLAPRTLTTTQLAAVTGGDTYLLQTELERTWSTDNCLKAPADTTTNATSGLK